jgi:hypothetical protein
MAAGRTRAGLVTLVAALVLASAAAGDAAPGDELTIGVVPQRWVEGDETEAMVEAGIGSVRVWFAWPQVEPKRDELDWDALDRQVAANAAAGLTTLPFLFGTPGWAGQLDGSPCYGLDCMTHPPRSSATLAEFAEFARAAVRRYGHAGTFWGQRSRLPYRPIGAWQIWNEPNLSSFFRPAVDPVAYASILQAAAAEIRAQDPAAEILIGGLTGTETNSRRMSSGGFLRGLYSVPGIGSSFDGIAIHPYSRHVRGVLDQVESARRIAEAYGDDPGLWITELGWASAGKRRWGLTKTRRKQANLLTRVFSRLLAGAEAWDLRAVYWYSWRDTDRGAAVCGWCPWSGLIDRAGRAKPAYRALQRVTLDPE